MLFVSGAERSWEETTSIKEAVLGKVVSSVDVLKRDRCDEAVVVDTK